MRRLSTRGDTLIEVLVVLAVVGTVLTGAYVAARRGQLGGRQAQERSEAVKVLEAQVEKLKYLAPLSDNPSQNIFIPGDFCISGVNVASASSGACRQGPQNRYRLSINYSSTDQQFTAFARWDRLGGGQDEARMLYRVYE